MNSWEEQQWTRRVFLAPGELEDDQAFRSTLVQLLGTGLTWGGVVGILGVLFVSLVNWSVLGRPITWWYPTPITTEAYVLWDKAVVVLACGGAIALGRAQSQLTVGRIVGGLIAVLIATVSLVHDAYRGILSPEYLVLINLLAVAVIPYRPWQALLLGATLITVFYGIGHYGLPGTAAANPDLVRPGHLMRMSFASAALAVVSGLLLSTRYQQHRARQEAEDLHDQVAELEQAKSRFFADVSHEFRTPLTLLLGSVREALDERLGDLTDALRNRLEVMESQARRMKRLVNQLLELSTLDEGRMPLSMQTHDLPPLTHRIATPFRSWAEEEGLSFHIETQNDSLEVWVDPDRYEHILANLLSNAIKYTPEDGAVRVRVEETDDYAEIAVRDTGPGLPEEIRERIFEEGQSNIPVRAESSSGSSEPRAADRWIGMGIGLAHARGLVRRHQGDLLVESEPGFGTEITVRLPLGREHVADADVSEDPDRAVEDRAVDVDLWRDPGAPSPDAADADGDTPADAPRILVVDDETEMRGYLQDLLGTSYRVTTVSNGAEALDRLRNQPPDLVISDVAMPELDGISLCKRIREDDELRPLPVILLTGRQEAEARLSGLEAGANAYVAKPFDPAELEARIENLIEIRRLVQDRVRVPDWMEPKEASISSDEADFLEKLNETVDEHIDNSNFGVDWLADEMDLSTRHLRRRLKEVTRLSPAGFIRTRRLQHAAALLEEGADTISDVAAAVGYRDPSYFSRLFRETFGCSPTEYAEQAEDRSERSDITP
jgi:signal transduction histidine kinase/DNA-binding response OmpR family regulator